jgi:hypothetical protein
MKRKLKWLAIVLAVSLLGFGTALLLWPRDRITAESWQKIRIGMTEDEVAEILGGPGLSWEEHSTQYGRLEKELGRAPFEQEDPWLQEPELWFRHLHRARIDWDRVKVWTGRRGIIEIRFDEASHVCWKHFQGARWNNGNILDRLCDWLGW